MESDRERGEREGGGRVRGWKPKCPHQCLSYKTFFGFLTKKTSFWFLVDSLIVNWVLQKTASIDRSSAEKRRKNFNCEVGKFDFSISCWKIPNDLKVKKTFLNSKEKLVIFLSKAFWQKVFLRGLLSQWLLCEAMELFSIRRWTIVSAQK